MNLVQHFFTFCILVAGISAEFSDFLDVSDGEGKYWVRWEIDSTGDWITFEIEAATTGFVGFGISVDGQIDKADFVFGGCVSDTEQYLEDRHGVGDGLPELDDLQDYTSQSIAENGTHTSLRFYRRLDITGSDEPDEHNVAITPGFTSVIWFIGNTDDRNDEAWDQIERWDKAVTLIPEEPTDAPETTEPSTPETTEPPATETTEPSGTESTDPPGTKTTEPPGTGTTEPPGPPTTTLPPGPPTTTTLPPGPPTTTTLPPGPPTTLPPGPPTTTTTKPPGPPTTTTLPPGPPTTPKPPSNIGDSCKTNEDCDGFYQYCEGEAKQCKCKEFYREVENVCKPRSGAPCKENSDCQNEELHCVADKCGCKGEDFIEIEDGTCKAGSQNVMASTIAIVLAYIVVQLIGR